MLRRRSVVFLISDFIDTGFEQPLRSLARRHDVIAITLVDPIDLELPDLGLVEVEDAERGGRLLIDTGDPALRARYAAAAAERAHTRRTTFTTAGVDEVVVRARRRPRAAAGHLLPRAGGPPMTRCAPTCSRALVACCGSRSATPATAAARSAPRCARSRR